MHNHGPRALQPPAWAALPLVNDYQLPRHACRALLMVSHRLISGVASVRRSSLARCWRGGGGVRGGEQGLMEPGPASKFNGKWGVLGQPPARWLGGRSTTYTYVVLVLARARSLLWLANGDICGAWSMEHRSLYLAFRYRYCSLYWLSCMLSFV